MTPLERQHATERAILGDGCPADLTEFARRVAAAEWKCGATRADVPASAKSHLRRRCEMKPRGGWVNGVGHVEDLDAYMEANP